MSTGLDRESRPLRVTQLRHYPGSLAMERFANEIGVATAQRPDLAVAQFRPRPSRMPHRPGSRRQFTRLVRYPYVARGIEADVVHIVDQGMSNLAAGLDRERTVITCHDVMPLRAARGDLPFRAAKRTLARYRLAARYMRTAGAVVCVSEVSRRDLIELVGVDEDRASTVRLGIGREFGVLPEQSCSELRAELPGHRFLLFHPSYTRHTYKNVEGVIRTLAAVRRAGIDAGLIRVGRPLLRDERRLAVSLGVESEIHELGTVSDARMVELYNATDALIFPSFYEGFGWPVLESMACGTPVVASDCEAIAEASGGAALLAGHDDVEALAAHLGELATSPELDERMRRRGLERAAEYTWADTAAHYASVYQGLAGDQRTTEPADPHHLLAGNAPETEGTPEVERV